MKTNAWIIEPPRQDVSDLYDKYTVQYVFRDRMQVDVFRDDPEKFFEYMQEWAKLNFNVNDFFVLTGNLTMIVAATLAIAKVHSSSRILFLRYDHGLQRYCEVSLDSVCS